MDDLRAIQTEADYQRALEEIAVYFEHQPARGTPEADRFDRLAALIEEYEDTYYPVPLPGRAFGSDG